MSLDHTAMSDEEMLQIVDQWEAEGLLETSWLQTPETFLSLSSSSSTTPSESSHHNSFPFPASDPASSHPPFLSSPPIEQDREDDTAADDRPRSSRDPAKRKQQNRNAQRAHRDRQKKLIHDLWAEVHSLRSQNKQLFEMKMESQELKMANGRLRREIEAMERIWVEAVTHEVNQPHTLPPSPFTPPSSASSSTHIRSASAICRPHSCDPFKIRTCEFAIFINRPDVGDRIARGVGDRLSMARVRDFNRHVSPTYRKAAAIDFVLVSVPDNARHAALIADVELHAANVVQKVIQWPEALALSAIDVEGALSEEDRSSFVSSSLRDACD